MTEPGSRSNDGNCLVEGTERHNEEGFLIVFISMMTSLRDERVYLSPESLKGKS